MRRRAMLVGGVVIGALVVTAALLLPRSTKLGAPIALPPYAHVVRDTLERQPGIAAGIPVDHCWQCYIQADRLDTNLADEVQKQIRAADFTVEFQGVHWHNHEFTYFKRGDEVVVFESGISSPATPSDEPVDDVTVTTFYPDTFLARLSILIQRHSLDPRLRR